MSMIKNLLLYTLTALIWGSTWIAITYQLGTIDPVVSIAYRFFLASLLLLLYTRLSGRTLAYSISQHGWMTAQGFFLFGLNYVFVYHSEIHVTSGLVAILFSLIMFFNMINSSLFLKLKIQKSTILGAILGLTGIVIVFNQELLHTQLSGKTPLGMFFALAGAYSASLGNILSARNQKHGLPVIQTNAFGMLYGSLLMLIAALVFQRPLTIDFSAGYMISLFYLSIFGSVIAFTAYLTLIGRVGASRASYVMLVFPVIALMLSNIFEGYQWSLNAVIGISIILIGNVLILAPAAGNAIFAKFQTIKSDSKQKS